MATAVTTNGFTRWGSPLLRGLIVSGLAGLLPNAVESQAEVRMRGFAEVGFSASNADGQPSEFDLGQLDNFVTGSLSDRIDFVTEAVLEYDDDWIFDLERLWVRYQLTPNVSVSSGKFHTPIGYWNRTYHHGALLQPSLERPALVAFEDEGGPLPVHTTGILLSGSNFGSAEVGFAVMIGNGIGSNSVSDNNEAKSISGRVTARPSDMLSLGLSAYRDHISAGTRRSGSESATVLDVDQTLLGADAQLRVGRLDVLSEVVWANNTTTSSFRSWGYYALASFAVDDQWSPYGKLDELQFASNDPYFGGADTRVVSVGVRYSLELLAALKAEVRHTRWPGSDQSSTAFHVRMAFGW